MVVGGGHAFAHQHGIRAGATVILDLDRTEHARLCDADHVIGQSFGEFGVFVHVNLQVLEIARVDADDPGAGRDRAADLLGGVRFDEHGHAELVGEFKQVRELIVVQRGDDEQH